MFLRNSDPSDIKLGLERISELLFMLGNPQESLNIIHITGTNGKGSTGAFIVNSLVKSGYRTGWFATPAVVDNLECIQVLEPDFSSTNSNNINYNYSSTIFNKLHKKDLESKAKSDVDFSLKNITDFFKPDLFKSCIEAVEFASSEMAKGNNEPSIFEKQTALAYLYFYKKNVDIAVIEVGMGGLNDATNTITKNLVSVITNISVDHEAFLGRSIEDIAEHKAGIIKPGCPVVVGVGEKDSAKKVVFEKAAMTGSRLCMLDDEDIEVKSCSIEGSVFSFEGERYTVSMIGSYQVYNAALAVKVLKVLRDTYPDICGKIEDKTIKKGLENTKLPGRCEVISTEPYVIYDGAHNPHAALSLKTTIEDIFDGRNIYAICGVYKDKDAMGILEILAPYITEFVAISPSGERGLGEDELLELWESVTRHDKSGRTMRDVAEAVELYRYKLKTTDPEGVVLVFGSLSLRRGIRIS